MMGLHVNKIVVKIKIMLGVVRVGEKLAKLHSNQVVSCACHELEENHNPDDCYCMTGQNDNFEKWIDEHE